MANLDLAGIITRVCTDLRAKFSKVTVERHKTSGTKSATVTVDGVEYDLYAPTPPTESITAPLMDGTASYGSGTSYARSNHRHPTDTSRQETLVSGTNIKTINNESLLGSGNITTPTYTLPTASTSTLGGVKVDGTTITAAADGTISASGGGGNSTGGVTVRGTYAIIPARSSSAGTCKLGIDGIDAHDILVFFNINSNARNAVNPNGMDADGDYYVYVSSSTSASFGVFVAIISPNYQSGTQASIIGNTSMCNTTTPLVGDTVTISQTSGPGSSFTVYDAASGGVYAKSGTVQYGETWSFTVECATSYIDVIASGGGND